MSSTQAELEVAAQAILDEEDCALVEDHSEIVAWLEETQVDVRPLEEDEDEDEDEDGPSTLQLTPALVEGPEEERRQCYFDQCAANYSNSDLPEPSEARFVALGHSTIPHDWRCWVYLCAECAEQFDAMAEDDCENYGFDYLTGDACRE